MTISLRGSHRKARAILFRWGFGSTLLGGAFALVFLLGTHARTRFDLIAPPVLCGLAALGCLTYGVLKAASVARNRLEITPRELRRPVSCWRTNSPWVALPLHEILLSYSRPKSVREGEVIIVTTKGIQTIPDHFDVAPWEIARACAPRAQGIQSADDRCPDVLPTGSRELDELVQEQLRKHSPATSVVHFEPRRFVRRGLILSCAFFGLAVIFVLVGLLDPENRAMLYSCTIWFSAGVLTLLFVPSFPRYPFVVATPEWILLGARDDTFMNGLSHSVVPTPWVREIGHDPVSENLCLALKNGLQARGGTMRLEKKLRETLRLSGDDPAVSLAESADILGLPLTVTAEAIATAGLHQDQSTVGYPRWRRSEIERLRGRLIEAPGVKDRPAV